MVRFVYRILRFNQALRRYLGRRLTTSGLMVLACCGIAGLLGLDTKQSLSYQLFTLLLALLSVSMATSRLSRYRFRAERHLPRFGTVGVPLQYRVVVENGTKRRQQGLKLLEGLVEQFPSLKEFQRINRTPGSWSQRRRRWLRTLARRRWAVTPATDLPELPIQEKITVTSEITPLRRGLLQFKHLTVACPDPLGLVNTCIKLALPQSVLILPKRYELPTIQLPGARRHQSGGVALASSVGDAEEFRALREYRPGDSPRKIHWKSWAKLGKPVVKESQDEYFVRHALILDTFQTEAYSDVLEEAVAIAASLACEVQTQESLLDMVFVEQEAHCFTVGRGLGQTERMLELLASVVPCQDKPFESLLPVVQERLGMLSGCICIFLGWDGDRKMLLQQLHSAGIPTLALVIAEAETAPDPAALSEFQTQHSSIHVLTLGQIQEGLWQI